MRALMEIYHYLLKHFGPQDWWPMQKGFLPREWEVEVGAILTQNTSWKNVEIALRNLKKEGIVSREDVIKTPARKLANMIRSSGYYNQKAKKLKTLAGFTGKPARERLLSLWGIGKETADSILLYAYGKPVFVVDAYTKRIFSRLGLIEKEWDYERVREFFEKNLPRKTSLYKEYHALIVEFGKSVCKTKPLCGECVLNNICSHKLSL